MATTVPVVPEQKPEQTLAQVPRVVNPYRDAESTVWWGAQTVTDIPPHAVGWMVANGWRVVKTTRDTSTVPPTVYYEMATEQIDPASVLLSLCNSWTREANNAREANNFRYRDVINDWTKTIASTQTHAANETEQQNACLGVYLTDLKNLDEIDDLISINREDLQQEYNLHKSTTQGRLDDLGQTELARINEQFSATLSVQRQQLIDQGLYNATVNTDITARNERDRDEQIQLLNDRLMREKLQNDHQLYSQVSSLANFNMQAIIQKMNVKVTQMEGHKRVNDDNMRLMAYQLDTRNQLLIGLYGFSERREDVAPGWENMSTMIAALGESGGGSWVQP